MQNQDCGGEMFALSIQFRYCVWLLRLEPFLIDLYEGVYLNTVSFTQSMTVNLMESHLVCSSSFYLLVCALMSFMQPQPKIALRICIYFSLTSCHLGQLIFFFFGLLQTYTNGKADGNWQTVMALSIQSHFSLC